MFIKPLFGHNYSAEDLNRAVQFSELESQFTAETPQDAEAAQRFFYLLNLCASAVNGFFLYSL